VHARGSDRNKRRKVDRKL